MAELVPIPLDIQLRRAFTEYEREGKIFDLPRDKFYRGLQGLDASVVTNGHRAATPLGPAAGPHSQLLQNIVLCWLGGARIIELKTVQVLDQLNIPRPCIDTENITYNVEWSQELRLEQSLREYTSAAMFLRILEASGLVADAIPPALCDTVFDMSAGYNLEGIRSPRVRAWLEGMKDASTVVDELRSSLTGRFRQYRDLPFPPRISDTITLSTFHGCPAEEIEGIVSFLLTEMGLNVCVKMNPTLLGREHVEHLLHDVLGYRDIELVEDAFDKDLKFDAALDLVRRLQAVASAHGRQLSLKFSNTLVVRNHRQVFNDELMYMSGPALHVLTLNLVRQFRERMGAVVPLSFSAGMTAQNVADMVAMNFAPVTTCTDLLKTGGYGRLHKYMDNLGEAMRDCDATTIPEFVIRHAGQGAGAVERVAERLGAVVQLQAGGAQTASTRAAEMWIKYVFRPILQAWVERRERPLRELCAQLASKVSDVAQAMPGAVTSAFVGELSKIEHMLVDEAGLLNTPVLVDKATADPRYRWEQNKAAPRKIRSRLSLFDCIACDKCVPLCPNDANFVYDAQPVEIKYSNYELLPGGGFRAIAGGVFSVKKPRQLANYADACNECGNCSVFCPEDGGPNVVKPRFFGSIETYRKDAGQNGFYIKFEGRTKTIHATIGANEYSLTAENGAATARFIDAYGEYTIDAASNALVGWHVLGDTTASELAMRELNLLPYLRLKFLLEAVSDPRRVNYANAAAIGSQG